MILLQFAVYRNYSSPVNLLMQHSAWESDPKSLRKFMEGISVSGGINEEAVEIGLQHALVEVEAGNENSIPLRQVFLIGDAPANPTNTVLNRRGGQNKWVGSKYE